MQLREYNYSISQTVRKRCIHYAKDNNTIVKHWRDLYPLEVITGHMEFAGLYLQYEKIEYSELFRIYIDLGSDCVEYGYLSGWYGVTEEVVEHLMGYVSFIGLEGYKARLAQMEQKGAWINNAMIRGLSDAGEVELAEHYREYHEEQNWIRDEENRVRRAEYEREHQEEEQARQAEIEEKILATEKCILERREVMNEPFEGKTIILYLMKKHGIIPPLRTQGWINEKLVKVRFGDGSVSYTFRKMKKGKASQTTIDCLFQLRNKIAQAYSTDQAA